MKSQLTNNKGFTLLEILVVLTIMGFLLAMIAPRLGGISDSAVGTVCDTNQSRMVTYMATYVEQTGRFPSKLTNMVNDDAGTYAVPTASDEMPDNGNETFAAELVDRNAYALHILSAAEATELKGMGIAEVLNLNPGMEGLGAPVDPTSEAYEEVDVAAGVGVLTVGAGVATSGGAWVLGNTSVGVATERGWGEPDMFGRIVLGMGPESGLITDGMIANAAHCPGGLQNADNFSYNDYIVVLPRLEATVAAMEDATNPITAVITDSDGAPGIQVAAVAYDDEPVFPYDITANADLLKTRTFTITEAQNVWMFDTMCPEGHKFPAADEEFWGVDLGGTAGSID